MLAVRSLISGALESYVPGRSVKRFHSFGLFIAPLVSFLLLSANCSPVTDYFDHQAFLCGQKHQSPMIKYTAHDGRYLGPETTRVFVRTRDSSAVTKGAELNAKGCLEVTKNDWERVLVTTIDDRFGARLRIKGDASIFDRQLSMKPRSNFRPSVECGKEVVFSVNLNLSNFVDLTDVDYPDFVVLHASIMDDDEHRLKSFQVWGDKVFEGYSIPSLPNGRYLLNITIIDQTRDHKPIQATCRFLIDREAPVVHLGDKITHFKTYLGMDFGVVSPGYQVNFHFEGASANFDIEYCLLSINPNGAYDAARTCPDEFLKVYSREAAQEQLYSGLWEIRFRARKRGHPPGRWQVQHVVVDVLCVDNFSSPQILLERQCTEVLGAVLLEGMDITDEDLNKLGLISVIHGNLIIKETAALEPRGFRHLSSVGGLIVEKNSHLLRFVFDNLEQVRGTVSLIGVRDQESHFVFRDLRRISGKVDLLRLHHSPEFQVSLKIGHGISIGDCFFSTLQSLENIVEVQGRVEVYDNEDLQILSGFNSLVSAQTIKVSRNPHLQKISGFRSLRFLANLEVESTSDTLHTVDLPKLSSLYMLSLTLDHPVELGWINDIQNLRYLTLRGQWAVAFIQNRNMILNTSHLTIIQSSLVSFSNLSVYLSISGTLALFRNNSLVDIDTSHIPGIVPESLYLKENAALERVHVPNVSHSMKELIVEHSPHLHHIKGFGDLMVIRENLVLKDLGVRDLTALRGLRRVERSQLDRGVILTRLPRLENFDWLDKLVHAPLLKLCQVGKGLIFPEALAVKFDSIVNMPESECDA